MITRIKNKESKDAAQMHALFQSSYAVEAKLLGAEGFFPPLQRTTAQMRSCDNPFYGYYEGEDLLGLTELELSGDSIHIRTMIVAPKAFRKGIATQLMDSICAKYNPKILTVETGRDNPPARRLYEGYGFLLERTFPTSVGIVKVAYRMELIK